MVEFYDCATDENSLVMEAPFTGRGNSFSVCHAASIGGPRRFDPGMLDNVSDRSELNVVARITLKDKEMCNAFDKFSPEAEGCPGPHLSECWKQLQ